jgi:hypothetical protein
MPDVGDQFNEKTVALIIQSAKFDAKMLAKAFEKLAKAGGNQKKGNSKEINAKGKQTVRQLLQQGQDISSVELGTKNIKSFESVARKYGIDFALIKDKTERPPKWIVFFRGRDAEVLTAAFKEFSAKEAKRQRNAEKPSLRKSLQKFVEKVKNQVIDKVKNKGRGDINL